MRNRPINPKAETRNLDRAGTDVEAMVQDRRSGRGKANGVPAHLPVPAVAADRISDDEAALLRHQVNEERAAHETADRARTIADATTIAVQGSVRHLSKKYGLAGQDSINPGTGKITRNLVEHAAKEDTNGAEH